MTVTAPTGSASAQSGPQLPKITTLSPRQQMGICCARCGQYLGARGRPWGEVRQAFHDRVFSFLLWLCAGSCQPLGAGPVQGQAPANPAHAKGHPLWNGSAAAAPAGPPASNGAVTS